MEFLLLFIQIGSIIIEQLKKSKKNYLGIKFSTEV